MDITSFIPLNPFAKKLLKIPHQITKLIQKKDWNSLDQIISQMVKPDGIIFNELNRYKSFSYIEHIISIRTVPDEDGIWHDDGSRILAFTLSLIENPHLIQGGELLIRKKFTKSTQIHKIPPQPFGTLIIFKTGVDGYEHKVLQVNEGFRIIAAGWCYT